MQTNNCESCERTDIKFALNEFSVTEGLKTRNFCSDLHLVLYVLKRFSARIKAETSTNSTRLYITATNILTKLSKAFDKEWKATAKK